MTTRRRSGCRSPHELPGPDRGRPIDVAGQPAGADLVGGRDRVVRRPLEALPSSSSPSHGQQRPGRASVAIEGVAARARVDDQRRPKSRTSATCVWPQAMARASVRVMRWTVTDGSRSTGRPSVWLPGEAWQTSTSRSSTRMPALGRAAGAGRPARRRRAGRGSIPRRRGAPPAPRRARGRRPRSRSRRRRCRCCPGRRTRRLRPARERARGPPTGAARS